MYLISPSLVLRCPRFTPNASDSTLGHLGIVVVEDDHCGVNVHPSYMQSGRSRGGRISERCKRKRVRTTVAVIRELVQLPLHVCGEVPADNLHKMWKPCSTILGRAIYAQNHLALSSVSPTLPWFPNREIEPILPVVIYSRTRSGALRHPVEICLADVRVGTIWCKCRHNLS
jgi:hypothetical protein